MVKQYTSIFQNLLNIVQRDINGRGIKKLIPQQNLEQFINSLEHLNNKSQNITILTGFQCNKDLEFKAENDGIAGSLIIARQLLRMNKNVTVLIDYQYEKEYLNLCENYLKKYQQRNNFYVYGFQPQNDNSQQIKNIYESSDTFLSIERPSVTKSGKYFTMNAFDISPFTCNIDQYLYPSLVDNPLFFGKNKQDNKFRISIGDGGNEVGMANVFQSVVENVKNGEQICAQTLCDSLIVCDVSNWGAFTLVEGLNIYRFLQSQDKQQNLQSFENHNKIFGIQKQEEIELYLNVANQGFRDGIVQLLDGTVDGQPLSVTEDIIQEIKNQYAQFIKQENK